MFISKIIKTNEGTVEFKGEFSEAEHEFLLEYALQNLVERGLIPLKVSEADELCNISPGTKATH